MKKIIVFSMMLSLFAFAEESKQSCKNKGFKFDRKAKACKDKKTSKRKKCENLLGEDGWNEEAGSCKVSRKELKLLKGKIKVKSLKCKSKIKIGRKAAAAVKSLTENWNQNLGGSIEGKYKNIIALDKNNILYIKAGKQFVKAKIMPTSQMGGDSSQNKKVMIGSKVIRFNAREGSLDSKVLEHVIFGSPIQKRGLKVEEKRLAKATKAANKFKSAQVSSCEYYFDGKQFKQVKGSKNKSNRNARSRRKNPGQLVGGR